MNEETLQLLKGSGYDTSKIPQQLSQQPAQQDQNQGLRSFDDPAFVDELVSAGSPEAAEERWRKHTGADEVFASVDREVLAMKAANPKLPGGMFTSIGESRKAELKAQAPGLGALEQAKRTLTDMASTMKSNFDKFSPELQAMVGQDVASGKPFTKAVADRLPQHLELLSVKQAKDNSDPLKGYIGGSGGSSGSGDNSAKSDYNNADSYIYDTGKMEALSKEFSQNPARELAYARLVAEDYSAGSSAPATADTPEAQAMLEEAKGRREKSKVGVDLFKKTGGLVIEDGAEVGEIMRAAKTSGKPLLVLSPDGKAYVEQITSDTDATRIAAYLKTARGDLEKKAKEEEKDPGMFTKARQLVFGLNEEELKSVIEKESGNIKSDDVLIRANAIQKTNEAKELLSKRQIESSENASMEKYRKLESRVSELKSLLRSPNLDDKTKDEAKSDLSKSSSILQDMEKLKEIKLMLAKREAAIADRATTGQLGPIGSLGSPAPIGGAGF